MGSVPPQIVAAVVGPLLYWSFCRRSADGTRDRMAVVRSAVLTLALLLLGSLPLFIRHAKHFGWGFAAVFVAVPFLHVVRVAFAVDLLIHLFMATGIESARKTAKLDLIVLAGFLIVASLLSRQLGIPVSSVLSMEL